MGDTQAGTTPPVRAADAAAPVFSRCVVAGASGGVGGMFTGLLLRSGVEVTRVDLAARREGEPGVRDVADDIRAPGPAPPRGGGRTPTSCCWRCRSRRRSTRWRPWPR
ncbi:hypothetical protein [Streptomyces albogriseolus]|uniref:hypothetical protein n=1 Tax=Streptomyces albogriseolus TaxID=1887 RepID=UPI003CFAEC96